ncbi:hypothetical protein KFL_001160270 [Klebsormidium nitens]|uniref:SET domain-containing protein n=1 Tax=Klebsormidium nitens TaxID=105231 RepID=A0A1Y1HWR0_KLENI|nr:hypothetical protein KFL_001160270 [Klebsormidium nitens]|eukprot:GAQ82593.1 hypothetical protein KFL_001160270 [Klebsormidium nitens]
MFKKLLDAFSPSSFFQKLNKRRLQQEIDTHRLFLLTRYKACEQQGTALATDVIQKEADETSFEEQKKQVQENVHRQIVAISRLLHSALTPGWEQAQIEVRERLSRTKRQSGLGMAVGGGASHQPGSDLKTDVRTISREELSEKLRAALGYTLRLAPSKVKHADAGTGLFLSGVATPGSVVGLYPGVIYDPSQYRQIPGYPRIGRDNPYFIARFDGVVIDAKPWGAGGDRRFHWDGVPSLEEICVEEGAGTSGRDAESEVSGGTAVRFERTNVEGQSGETGVSTEGSGQRSGGMSVSDREELVEKLPVESTTAHSNENGLDPEAGTRDQVVKGGASGGLGWWRLVAVGEGRTGSKRSSQGTLLETRHPLALAHFANHPEEGVAPNVVVCPYDFHVSGPGMDELRPYVPNTLCPDKGPQKRADTPIGYRSIWETRDDDDQNLDRPGERVRRPDVVRTLVLIASKEIKDEEVLLNYRLSPHVKPPDWYHPVDSDEDKRRWS